MIVELKHGVLYVGKRPTIGRINTGPCITETHNESFVAAMSITHRKKYTSINSGLPPEHQPARRLRPFDTISGRTVNSQIACWIYNVCSSASALVSKVQQ